MPEKISIHPSVPVRDGSVAGNRVRFSLPYPHSVPDGAYSQKQAMQTKEDRDRTKGTLIDR
jgi:hypothetical protein